MIAKGEAPTNDDLAPLLETMTPVKIIEHLIEVGADTSKVNRNQLAQLRRRLGLPTQQHRTKGTQWMPWDVKPEHTRHVDAQMLRYLSRAMAGEALQAQVERSLGLWIDALEEYGHCVTYDPVEGFGRRPRRTRALAFSPVDMPVEWLVENPEYQQPKKPRHSGGEKTEKESPPPAGRHLTAVNPVVQPSGRRVL